MFLHNPSQNRIRHRDKSSVFESVPNPSHRFCDGFTDVKLLSGKGLRKSVNPSQL